MPVRIVAWTSLLIGTLLAILAGPQGPLGGFWRPQLMNPVPEGATLAGLIGARVFEAVGVGLALAALAAGRHVFIRLTSTAGRAVTAQVATAWLLGSWWAHSALHLHFGTAARALVAIEWVFHAGSIVAIAALILALWRSPAASD
ncbi:MAG TPA: hypothetical protein VF163_01295 [Micromonosporaceae bacterium]